VGVLEEKNLFGFWGVGKSPFEWLEEVEMNKTRPGEAGKRMGEAIIEMVHLMYQKTTAMRFLLSLYETIGNEIGRRNEES
jgi:hypothetical protein